MGRSPAPADSAGISALPSGLVSSGLYSDGMTWVWVLVAGLVLAAITGLAWSLLRRRRMVVLLGERTEGRELVVTAAADPLASEAPDLEAVLSSGEVAL